MPTPVSRPRRMASNAIKSSSGSRMTMQSIDDKYAVFRQGFEGITQDLYDYQTYAQAGQTQLTFFQVPVGQSSKTLADTNMQIAGQLPQAQKFLCDGIRVDFIPGAVASATGAIVAGNWNDTKLVGESGSLTFNIGVKTYHQGAPLKCYPVNKRIAGAFALSDTTTAAAARVTKIDYASFDGELTKINPVMIPSNESFAVTLTWPAAVATAVAGRIGVRLDGILFRRSQ